jgi:hypothetical protein
LVEWWLELGDEAYLPIYLSELPICLSTCYQ